MADLDSLTSPLLDAAGFRHAFFTRLGGVSTGPYASLNFSTAVGDAAAPVRENLRRAGLHLGVGAERVFFASQVHGADVLELLGEEDREQVLLERRVDAIFSLKPGLACGVRTADCVPILVGDRKSGAGLAIHAGWRGTVLGVIEAAIGRLRERLGAAGDLIAAIGPHISVAAFEVSEEVASELSACSPVPDVVDRSRGEKPHVDLRRIVRGKLEVLGLGSEDVDDVLGCTVGEPARLFSYRRDGKQSGRHLSAVVPRGLLSAT